MERICPFLATGDDGRAVVDGYDATHVCRAGERAQAVDRSQQLGICLDVAHRSCERYAEAMRRRGPTSWPAPAPDAAILQTRLVLPPSAGRRQLTAGPIGPRGRRWLIGGALAAVGVAAVATGAVGGLGSMVASRETTPAPSASQPAAPSFTPVILASPSASPTVLPTEAPTAVPTSLPTPVPTPVPTAAPTVRTYVVQLGDTLNGLALRFGTTVQAIKDANNLTSDIINVGQVLIIP
jgi:nucleoid-associated protein YgaU